MVVNPTEVYLYDSCDNLTNHIKHHRQSKTDFVAVPRNPRNKGFDFIFFVYMAMLTKHQILFMQATIAMSHSALMKPAVDIVENVRNDICAILIKNVNEPVSYRMVVNPTEVYLYDSCGLRSSTKEPEK